DVSVPVRIRELEYIGPAVYDCGSNFARSLFGVGQLGKGLAFALTTSVVNDGEEIITARRAAIDFDRGVSRPHHHRLAAGGSLFMTIHDTDCGTPCAQCKKITSGFTY